jgi:hypothetical protein
MGTTEGILDIYQEYCRRHCHCSIPSAKDYANSRYAWRLKSVLIKLVFMPINLAESADHIIFNSRPSIEKTIAVVIAELDNISSAWRL